DNEKYHTGDKTILVNDVLETLQALAAHHRQQLHIPFIAITGSNGKTTTKELMHAVLSAQYKTYATEGNLNNHIGVPLTLLKIRQDADLAIIEMGANHLKEIAGYCQIAMPTHGLINNCGKAHLEGFGGVMGVRQGKGELYDYIRSINGTIFINTDLDYLIEMAAGISKQISYGSSNAAFRGKIYSSDPYLQVALLNEGHEGLVATQLVGEYNFPNVMAAVAVGNTFGISAEKINKAIRDYTPGNSRSQLIKAGTNTIIMDAYNANPTSMSAAIRNFAQADYPNKVIILGAMMELGTMSIEEHQQIVRLLQQSNWNQVLLVGGDFKDLQHSYTYFDDAGQAAEWFRNANLSNTAILIKGSRSLAMEQVLKN
ncbi:MAG: UDP-N-acetylmuramoyl-tripeptide--D-alanyl-D-alanine ligase, partial [Chitinophagaceae bacterium]|nr:UDP-N-acetylmuramoyl-tripeptide--D-alanyl-D-alanine ligase [Chitinophagaceae bacterium]